jgi:hypothetical protein
MNESEPQALVLRDRDGNCYLFSLDMLERARVPDERMEQFQTSIGGDDVAGFAIGIAGGITNVAARYIVDEVSEPLPVARRREGYIRSAWRAFRATRV